MQVISRARYGAALLRASGPTMMAPGTVVSQPAVAMPVTAATAAGPTTALQAIAQARAAALGPSIVSPMPAPLTINPAQMSYNPYLDPGPTRPPDPIPPAPMLVVGASQDVQGTAVTQVAAPLPIISLAPAQETSLQVAPRSAQAIEAAKPNLSPVANAATTVARGGFRPFIPVSEDTAPAPTQDAPVTSSSALSAQATLTPSADNGLPILLGLGGLAAFLFFSK